MRAQTPDLPDHQRRGLGSIRAAWLILAAALALLGGSVALGASTTPTGSPEGMACSDADLVEASSDPTPLELSQERQAAFVQAQLSEAYGERVDSQLEQGLLGTFSRRSGDVALVMDMPVAQRAEVEARLSDALKREFGDGQAIGVSVLRACRDSASLLQSWKAIEAGTWIASGSDDNPSFSYAYYVDAPTSTIVVEVGAIDPKSAENLRSLGGVDVIDAGGFERATRQKDLEPHKGGAGIRRPGDADNVCSSGFTAELPSGEKGSISAGHCFGDDIVLRSGPSGDSTHYGETGGKANFPIWDMIRIKPDGDDFTRAVWATNGSPSVRDVTGAGDPGPNTTGLCVSGMATNQTCGYDIINLNVTACGDGGCTQGLAKARGPNGVNQTNHGDSGAPVYLRDGNNALIRGMYIGFNSASIFFHTVDDLKDHLGISNIAP